MAVCKYMTDLWSSRSTSVIQADLLLNSAPQVRQAVEQSQKGSSAIPLSNPGLPMHTASYLRGVAIADITQPSPIARSTPLIIRSDTHACC